MLTMKAVLKQTTDGSQPSQLTSRSMNPHFHSPQAIHLTALLNPGGSGTAGTARSLRIDPKKKGL